jgi:hypothetical protein
MRKESFIPMTPSSEQVLNLGNGTMKLCTEMDLRTT